MKNIIIKDLGLINYQKCWDLQEKIHKSIIDIKRENKKKNKKKKHKKLFAVMRTSSCFHFR